MECGVKFYFSRILRVPSAPNQFGAFGTAIHAALREFVVKGVNAKKWMSQTELVKHFEYEMMKVRAGFTQKQFELRLEQGRSILPKYHAQKINQYEKYEKIETEFSINTKIEGISITGNLDKMVFEGNDITVYDYKTSKLKNTETKSKIPSKQSIDKGNFPPSYWFQLGLYTMMINEAFKDKNWKSRNAVIESLISNDDGQFDDFSMIYSNDDFDLIKSWVIKANDKLQSLNFMEGCNKCEWCQFAKESGQIIYIPNNDGNESTEE
jgi:DNA helicase-2/ATP-dependent DNA helicase PcrA